MSIKKIFYFAIFLIFYQTNVLSIEADVFVQSTESLRRQRWCLTRHPHDDTVCRLYRDHVRQFEPICVCSNHDLSEVQPNDRSQSHWHDGG